MKMRKKQGGWVQADSLTQKQMFEQRPGVFVRSTLGESRVVGTPK
jgi:hypothetical protein